MNNNVRKPLQSSTELPRFDVLADYLITFSKRSTNHPKNRDSLKEILSPQTYIIRHIKEIKDKIMAIKNIVEELESRLIGYMLSKGDGAFENIILRFDKQTTIGIYVTSAENGYSSGAKARAESSDCHLLLSSFQ
ncbi:23474_t:CDS:2, partial [Gigaspora margarita]